MKPIYTAVCALALLSGPALAQRHDEASRAAMPNSGETNIAREVRHQLVMLPYYGVFDDLAFRVDGSTVTLLGQVRDPVLKSDAGNVVKNVEGVSKVDNQIKVLPVSPMDDQIRRAEFRAIYSEASLNKYAYQAVPPIHIIVDNGHVTLVGVVATQADKTLAGLRANQVPNVFSVDNQLRVEGK